MIPRTLEEWSIPVIKGLLVKGYWESEFFDFKEMLPHKKNENDKHRLYKSCCAFANSAGGFLVFGISDDRSLNPEQRLVGLNPGEDFPERFGNYPGNCVPSIRWDFKNPPLELENGKVIHVVHIPRSWNAPHAIGDRENRWIYSKRTNKGNEGMSYEEVRLLFLGYYEKRLKLQLLIAELQNVRTIAEGLTVSELRAGIDFPLLTFDLSVINSVLSDTYTIISNEQDLLTLLMDIRNSCQNANIIIRIIHGIASNQDQIQNLHSHNAALNGRYSEIIDACSKAIPILQTITSP